MRPLTSAVWNFYKIYDEKDRLAICNQCKNIISFKSTVSNLKSHLRRIHNIDYRKFERFDNTRKSEKEYVQPECDSIDKQNDFVKKNSNSRVSHSSAWEYFTKIPGSDKLAACDLCLKHLSYKTTVTNLKNHLKHKHIDAYNSLDDLQANCYETIEDTEGLEAVCNIPNSNNSENESFLILVNEAPMQDDTEGIIPQYQSTQDMLQVKVEPDQIPDAVINNKVKTPTTKVSKTNKQEIDGKLLRFVITALLPISTIDNEDFTDFVVSLNPNYVLPTGKEITEIMIPSLYDKFMTNVKKLITEEASVVSLSIDRWTTVHEEEYMTLTIHFITNSYECKNILIKCCKIRNNCPNLLSIIEQTLNFWDLEDKVTACIIDNSPEIISAIQHCDMKNYRCIGDKLNSCVQTAMGTLEEMLSKVKKIVTYYMNSNRAKEMLQNYQNNKNTKSKLMLLEDASNRWDSTFIMVERFIKLQDAVKATMPDLYSNLPEIFDEEWLALKQLTVILKPFEIATKELSLDKFVSASKAVAVITGLNSILTDITTKNNDIFNKIDGVVQVLQTEMERQFEGIERDGDLPLCAVLDPRFKLDIFSNDDTTEKVKQHLITSVETLIQKDCEGQNVTESESEGSDDEVNQFSIWRHLNKAKRRRTFAKSDTRYHAIQEIENYLNDASGNRKCNPYAWWLQNNHKYPHLATLFRITCHLPASCVPYNSNNSILEYRKRLPTEMGEQLIFLNANLGQVDFDFNDL